MPTQLPSPSIDNAEIATRASAATAAARAREKDPRALARSTSAFLRSCDLSFYNAKTRDATSTSTTTTSTSTAAPPTAAAGAGGSVPPGDDSFEVVGGAAPATPTPPLVATSTGTSITNRTASSGSGSPRSRAARRDALVQPVAVDLPVRIDLVTADEAAAGASVATLPQPVPASRTSRRRSTATLREVFFSEHYQVSELTELPQRSTSPPPTIGSGSAAPMAVSTPRTATLGSTAQATAVVMAKPVATPPIVPPRRNSADSSSDSGGGGSGQEGRRLPFRRSLKRRTSVRDVVEVVQTYSPRGGRGSSAFFPARPESPSLAPQQQSLPRPLRRERGQQGWNRTWDVRRSDSDQLQLAGAQNHAGDSTTAANRPSGDAAGHALCSMQPNGEVAWAWAPEEEQATFERFVAFIDAGRKATRSAAEPVRGSNRVAWAQYCALRNAFDATALDGGSGSLVHGAAAASLPSDHLQPEVLVAWLSSAQCSGQEDDTLASTDAPAPLVVPPDPASMSRSPQPTDRRHRFRRRRSLSWGSGLDLLGTGTVVDLNPGAKFVADAVYTNDAVVNALLEPGVSIMCCMPTIMCNTYDCCVLCGVFR